jgi:hypothetical protein
VSEQRLLALEERVGRWAMGGLYTFDTGSQWLPWNVVDLSETYTSYTLEPRIKVLKVSGLTSTIVLPYANTRKNTQPIIIKRTCPTNGIPINVTTQSGETIDGASTYAISTVNESVTLVSDGTGWLIINNYIPV